MLCVTKKKISYMYNDKRIHKSQNINIQNYDSYEVEVET